MQGFYVSEILRARGFGQALGGGCGPPGVVVGAGGPLWVAGECSFQVLWG